MHEVQKGDENRIVAHQVSHQFGRRRLSVLSVAAICDQYDPLLSGLAALLLEWIPRLEDCRLRESVAWALLATVPNVMMG